MTAEFEDTKPAGNPNADNRTAGAVPPRGDRREDRDTRGARNARESISAFESRHARPISVRSNSDQLNQYRDGLEKALTENINRTYEGHYGVLAYDKSNLNTAWSVLLVWFNEKAGNKNYSAVFKLIVESTGGALRPQTLNYQGSQFNRVLVPGDLDGTALNTKLEKSIRDQFGQDIQLLDAGTSVIYREVDATNKTQMTNLIQAATTACWEVMSKALGEQEEPFSPKSLGANDVLSANIDTNPTPVVGIDGLPIRSDIRITLSGSEATNRDNRDANDGLHQASIDLTEIDLYVDVIHRGADATNVKPQYGRGGREILEPLFQPVINITNVTNRVSMMSLELAIAAIATTTILADNGEWQIAFKPQFDDRRAGIRDVGALGYEMAPYLDPKARPERVDTGAADFDGRALRDFLAETMTEYPVVRLHIPETGPQTWLLGMFLAAANGDRDAQDALNKAADNLTLGSFGSIYRDMGGREIAYDMQNRFPMGPYRSSTGEKFDIRELDDYIAESNIFGEKNGDTVIDWANTHEMTNVPVDVRTAKRVEILRHASQDTFELKGYGQVVEIDGIWLRAVAAGMVDAKMDIRSGSLLLDYRAGVQRGVNGASRNALDGSVGRLFQRGGYGGDRDSGRGGSAFSGRYHADRRW